MSQTDKSTCQSSRAETEVTCNFPLKYPSKDFSWVRGPYVVYDLSVIDLNDGSPKCSPVPLNFRGANFNRVQEGKGTWTSDTQTDRTMFGPSFIGSQQGGGTFSRHPVTTSSSQKGKRISLRSFAVHINFQRSVRKWYSILWGGDSRHKERNLTNDNGIRRHLIGLLQHGRW